MCAHESYKDVFYCELYDYNQSVPVSSDVEHIVLIAYIVRSWEVVSYVVEAFPCCLFCDFVPSLQCHT